MLRKKIEKKLDIWKNNRKQALLVTGARQIGKTYSIEKYIEANFENSIIINFAVRIDLIDLFAQPKNSEQILINLSSIAGSKMIKGKTAIFFDEIQLVYRRREELKKNSMLNPNSQDLLTASKALVIDGNYRFIFSGSLLGITINNVVLNPTGYLDVIQMYPLDFEEYLWAKGVGEEAINYVRECFINKKEVDESINNLFHDYFREFVLVGGMPEAVTAFLKDKNLHIVQIAQENIIHFYNVDITTYIYDEDKRFRVRDIYKTIPSELNSKNKKFVSSHVCDPNYLKNKNLQDEFLWLSSAAIALPVYNVTNAELPLVLANQRKTFKLFVNDIGLLDTMLFSTGIREKLLTNEKVINFGAPYENVAAQELWAHGFKDELFYYNSKKHGEVDFIIEYNNEVLPIEIKSGKLDESKTYNHTVLNNLMAIYKPKEAYVFGEGNVLFEKDNIIQFPIYMISFIEK